MQPFRRHDVGWWIWDAAETAKQGALIAIYSSEQKEDYCIEIGKFQFNFFLQCSDIFKVGLWLCPSFSYSSL